MIDWLDNVPLPSDWTTKTIGDAYVFTRKPSSVQVADFVTVPFVPMDLVPVQGASRISWIEKKTTEINSGTYFEKGDVLLSRITPSFENGKQGMADELPAPFGYGSTELIPIQSKPGVSDAHFLFYLLLHPTLRSQIASKMEGSTGRQRVSESLVRDWPIPFPTLDEQRKIAAVLGKVQAAVAVEGDLVRVARELKQAALRQLFTRGLRHEPQKQTTIGPVPESWDVAEAGSLCHFSSGGTPDRGNPAYWTGGTIPWVKTGEVNYRTISVVEECITELGLQNSAAKLLPAGTLVMAMYGQGVTRGRVARLGIAATTNQACAAISPRADSDISTDFLYHFFEFNYEYLRSLGHGANQKNLNLEIIRQVSVPVPPEAEQREIAAILATLDAKIAYHEKRQALLRELFRTLLHDLLTARRRVPSEAIV